MPDAFELRLRAPSVVAVRDERLVLDDVVLTCQDALTPTGSVDLDLTSASATGDGQRGRLLLLPTEDYRLTLFAPSVRSGPTPRLLDGHLELACFALWHGAQDEAIPQRSIAVRGSLAVRLDRQRKVMVVSPAIQAADDVAPPSLLVTSVTGFGDRIEAGDRIVVSMELDVRSAEGDTASTVA